MDIFCNGQPDRDDDRRNFVAMTASLEPRNLVWVVFALPAQSVQKIIRHTLLAYTNRVYIWSDYLNMWSLHVINAASQLFSLVV